MMYELRIELKVWSRKHILRMRRLILSMMYGIYKLLPVPKNPPVSRLRKFRKDMTDKDICKFLYHIYLYDIALGDLSISGADNGIFFMFLKGNTKGPRFIPCWKIILYNIAPLLRFDELYKIYMGKYK